MIRRIGHAFARFFRATTPDPFVLAILLTFVAFGLAALVEGAGPVAILHAWQGGAGFWSLLRFGMQMVLILVTGHALAASPLVARGIRALARVPKSGASAAMLVSLTAVLAALLNWGLGLIVGALLAREVGRSCKARGVRAHYPLLAAAGYTGLMVWHGGMSGSAPLKMTTHADLVHLLGADLAARIHPVPFTQTVFGSLNLLVTGGLVVLVPLLCWALAPRSGDESTEIDAFAPVAEEDASPDVAETWPDRIERSPWLVGALAIPLVASVVLWARETGFAHLDPNALNLIFLTAGLLLHGSVRRYARAVGDASKGAAGIVLQFPFYAGIMGVMRGTGLTASFAGAMRTFVSARLYPFATFVSASIINLFVPSGGGQWAVQGRIVVAASEHLHVPLAHSVMAFAYGDQLTNMLQPFWALPLLALTGVRARDIIGYTAVIMLAGGAWITFCLIAFG